MTKIRNGFGPEPGESLHSFIFRVLYRAGYSNYSSILNKGGWGEKPSIPPSARKLFDVFCNRELLQMFEASVPFKPKDSIFSSNFELLFPTKDPTGFDKTKFQPFKNVFYPTKERTYAGHTKIIKYCVDCMRNQIKQNGFAFFKTEWHYQFWCKAHSKPLRMLDWQMPLPRIVDAVKQLLKGESPRRSYKFERDITTEYTPTLSSKYLKLAPCTKTAIIEYLVARNKVFPDGYSELADYGLLSAQDKRIFTKWKLRKELISRTEEIYNIAMEQDYTATMHFLNEKTNLIQVRYVDDIVQSDYRWLLKDKTKDCSKCAVIHNIGPEKCSASQLIYIQKNSRSPLKTVSPIIDICHKKFHEQISLIYQHQNVLGVGTP